MELAPHRLRLLDARQMASGMAVERAEIGGKEQEETAMFTSLFHAPRSSDEEQLRARYLTLVLAATGAVLVLAIAASIGV